MKIYTLGDILKTEHLGDEKYVRVDEIERLKEAFNTLYEITMSNDDVFQRREHVIKIFGSQDDIDLWEQLKTFPEFIPSFKIG